MIAQPDALIRSLLLDETFSALSLAERTAVQQRILTEIKGRMLEDIVLLETKLANPKKQVFVLQFPVGEWQDEHRELQDEHLLLGVRPAIPCGRI